MAEPRTVESAEQEPAAPAPDAAKDTAAAPPAPAATAPAAPDTAAPAAPATPDAPEATPCAGTPDAQHLQGHWLLARLGKRVLRPGGLELTRRLLQSARPAAADRIVEFGPGVGKTATELLAVEPASYIGIDPNPQGRGALTAIIDRHPQARLVISDAATTGLSDGEADLVVGEAMLSMHCQKDKAAIIQEAARLLAPGGRYAIHELERIDTDGTAKGVGTPGDPVSKDISRTIKVGARPLTEQGWHELLTDAGLEVQWTGHAPMHLLEARRIVADEGVVGAVRFAVNLLRDKAARQRVLAMRASFRAHADSLGAIAVVAVKPR